ncbi:OmpA family protein [Carnimonas bestiolae]|uniref:OmpA family protein n=1 Tax=Carnimonas bestiolae TaxID=3402172 RepID=UPI003F4ADAE2
MTVDKDVEMNKVGLIQRGLAVIFALMLSAVTGQAAVAADANGENSQGSAAQGARQLDHQASQLRQGMAGSGAQVIRTATTVRLEIPNALLFGNDSSTLSEGVKPVLGKVASALSDFPDTQVLVTGYTDNTGSAKYNRQLSQLRAQAVANYLTEGGIPYKRLHIEGKGATNFVASNATRQDREKNRRVTITLVPPQYRDQVIQGQISAEQYVPGQGDPDAQRDPSGQQLPDQAVPGQSLPSQDIPGQ